MHLPEFTFPEGPVPRLKKEAAVAQAGPKTGRGWQRNFLAGGGFILPGVVREENLQALTIPGEISATWDLRQESNGVGCKDRCIPTLEDASRLPVAVGWR